MGQKLSRGNKASIFHMWHTPDLRVTFTEHCCETKCVSALHLYQGNYSVLIKMIEIKS